MSLLMSGEFGRVQHQLKSRSGYKNVARNLLNRSTSARPTYREDITSVRSKVALMIALPDIK